MKYVEDCLKLCQEYLWTLELPRDLLEGSDGSSTQLTAISLHSHTVYHHEDVTLDLEQLDRRRGECFLKPTVLMLIHPVQDRQIKQICKQRDIILKKRNLYIERKGINKPREWDLFYGKIKFALGFFKCI